VGGPALAAGMWAKPVGAVTDPLSEKRTRTSAINDAAPYVSMKWPGSADGGRSRGEAVAEGRVGLRVLVKAATETAMAEAIAAEVMLPAVLLPTVHRHLMMVEWVALRDQ
jgi:hypothetical protein